MGIRQKLLIFTLVIVWLSVAVAMIASTLLIEDQITQQQRDRLTNALAAIERQVSDDIPFLDKRFTAFTEAEATRALREVQAGSVFTFQDMLGVLRYYPDIREYLLEFGKLEGITNFAVYLPTSPAPGTSAGGAQLYIQYLSGMGALVIDRTTAIWWNPRNYFRMDGIPETKVFPPRLDTVRPLGFESFPSGPGVSRTYRLANGGYLTLQRKWDFVLETEEKDLGASIAIHDRDGRVVDGHSPVADMSPYLADRAGSLLTLEDEEGETFNVLFKPVVADGRPVGYVSVSISRQQAEDSIAEVISLSVGIGIAIMLVALLVALYLVDSVTLPIFQLMRDCRIIADGDLDHAIDTERNDEFGVLARAFANMKNAVQEKVAVINQKNEELEVHRDHLQEVVNRLQETEHVLSSAFESISDGFALFDREDRFVVANEAYLEAHPLVRKSLHPGMPFKEIVRRLAEIGFYGNGPDEVEEAVARRMRLYRSGGVYEYKDPDGRWFEMREYDTSDGGIALVRSDITRRKQAEEERRIAHEEAQKASRAKSEFLATMSHELRTPLNAILGFSDILAHQYLGAPDSEKSREYASDIHSSASHLLELVNDVLDVSAIEAGKVHLEMAEVQLGDIIGECAQTVSETLLGKNVELSVDLPTGLPSAFVDRRAIKQVVLNILSNAAKHTPEGGRISLAVKNEDRNFLIGVVDTGVGIAPERLEKIMEPFTHYAGNPYKAERGWGLGLAISKSLVDLHGGTITINSRLGEGTSVYVTLPKSMSAAA